MKVQVVLRISKSITYLILLYLELKALFGLLNSKGGEEC